MDIKRSKKRRMIRCASIFLLLFLLAGCSRENQNKAADNETAEKSSTANFNQGEEKKKTMPNSKKAPSNLTAEEKEKLKEYQFVTGNEDYELYLMESTLSVILRDSQTGRMIESTLSDANDDGHNNDTWNGYMRSGIVISAIKGTTDTYQVDLVTCKNKVEVSYTDQGFSAKIYFPQYQFGLTMNVELDGDSLVVNVPDDSIIEEKSDCYIGTISLYPMMGYTYLDAQKGYMLVPDGNGALIYLDNKDKKYASGFSQMIYGSDLGVSDLTASALLMNDYDAVIDVQKVLAPVYGMVHLDDELAYLAVVEKGEKRASIEAHPNGVMIDYNRCFAKFIERIVYVQPLNKSNSGTVNKVEAERTHSDLQVRYLFTAGENANYSGLARTYRSYLLDQKMVTPQDTSYKTRVDFLGTDREEWLVTTKAVTMTTAGQIENMYSDLQKAGVPDLLTVYKGWQSGGLYDVPVTKYKADSHIGGNRKLSDLIASSADKGYDIYLYDDGLRVNPSETNTLFNTVKKINKRTLAETAYGQVYDSFQYIIPNKAGKNLSKFISSCSKKNAANIALSGISNTLYSYSYKGKYYSRYQCADSYLNSIEAAYQNSNLILEQPFAYLWNDTKAFLDMPLSTSKYMYLDEEVPFLSMVLKGIVPMYSDYVNFEANQKEFLLQMIEAGVSPSFYLTYEDSSELIYTNSSDLYTTKYSTYRDQIVEYDHIFRDLAALTEGAYMVSHEKPQVNVVRVTYDNGTILYLNYNETPVTIDGITVDGMSYKAGGSHE